MIKVLPMSSSYMQSDGLRCICFKMLSHIHKIEIEIEILVRGGLRQKGSHEGSMDCTLHVLNIIAQV